MYDGQRIYARREKICMQQRVNVIVAKATSFAEGSGCTNSCVTPQDSPG